MIVYVGVPLYDFSFAMADPKQTPIVTHNLWG